MNLLLLTITSFIQYKTLNSLNPTVQLKEIISNCSKNLTSLQICQDYCPSNCLFCRKDSQCITCKQNFFLDSIQNLCQECPKECRECIIGGQKWQYQKICENQGYFFDGQIRPCLKNCKLCYGSYSCIQCMDGFIIDHQLAKCTKCPQNCLLCSLTGQCSECMNGFILINNGTCSKCQNYIDKCDNCFYANKTNKLSNVISWSDDFKLMFQTYNYSVYCSQCQKETILSPSLIKCESCDNCFCAYLDGASLIYPTFPPTIQALHKECLFCPDNQYMFNKTCHQCSLVCEFGCSNENTCNQCQDGFQRGRTSECLSCQVLTNVKNCRLCGSQKDDYNEWNCIQCYPGSQLNYFGNCVKCEDPYCSSTDNLKIINNVNAIFLETDSEKSVSIQTWGECQSMNSFQFSQIELDLLNMLNLKIGLFVPVQTIIPYAPYNIPQCQKCALGCKECQFAPFQYYGKCKDLKCHDGFTFMDGRCFLLDQKNHHVSIYQLTVSIEMNCMESSLQDVNQTFGSSDLYTLSKYLPLSHFILKVDIKNGQQCSLHETLEVGVDDQILYNTFVNEFILQSQNIHPTEIKCYGLSSCISLVGFNQITINNTLFQYNMLPYRQTTRDTYFFKLNLLQLNLEKIHLVNFKYSVDQSSQLSSLSRQIRGIFQLLFVNIKDTSFICLENITFSGNQMVNFSLINFGLTQYTNFFIANIYFQNVTLTNSILFPFQQQNSQQRSITRIQKLQFNQSLIKSSQILKSDDQNHQIYVQEVTLNQTIINGQGDALFQSVSIQLSQVIFSGCYIINQILVQPILVSSTMGLFVLNDLKFEESHFLTNTLILQYSSQNTGLQSSYIWIEAKNIYIYKTDLADLSQLASIKNIDIQQLFLNSIQQFQMLFNVDNCQQCQILLENVRIIQSYSVIIGSIQKLYQVKLVNIQNHNGCIQNSSQNQLQQSFIEIQSAYLNMTHVSLYNLIIQKPIIHLTNVQTLNIDQLELHCNIVFPQSGQQNPALLDITGSMNSFINISNSKFEWNTLIFYNNVIIIQEDLSVILHIFNPISFVSIKNIQIRKNQLYVQGSHVAAQSVKSLIPITYILSSVLIMQTCEFQGYMIKNDLAWIKQYIQSSKEIDQFYVLDHLSYISSSFMYLSQQDTIKITDSIFYDNIAMGSSGIVIVATNNDTQVQILQSSFKNLYSLQQGCAVTVKNFRGSKLALNIKKNNFSDIFGIQEPVFLIDQTIETIIITFESSNFKNCISLQGASILDFWQIQGQITRYKINDYQNMQSFFELFPQRIIINGCSFTEDDKFDLNPAKFFRYQGEQGNTILIRGSKIGIKFENCTFKNIILHQGLFQFSSSYIALLSINISDSLWGNILINLYDCFVYIRNISLKKLTLCVDYSVCQIHIKQMLKQRQIQTNQSIQAMADELNNNDYIIGTKQDLIHQDESSYMQLLEAQYYGQVQKLIVGQEIQFQLLKIIGYDIVIQQSQIQQINCSACTNAMIQIYYTHYSLSDLIIQDIYSTNSLLEIEEDLDNFRGGIIESCKFRDNIALCAIKLIQASTVIDKCDFQNSQTFQSQIYFTYDLRSSNTSTFLTVKNTNFTNNYGVLWSAAISVDEMQIALMKLLITDCSFLNNNGKLAGAVISRTFIPHGHGNTFLNNTARTSVHNDILGPPEKLRFIYNGQVINLSQIFPDNISSQFNNSLPGPIQVQLTQGNDEVILFNELESFQINQYLIATFKGDLYYITKHDNTSFIIQKLSMVSEPGDIIQLQITSQLLKSFNTYNISFKVRNCTQGEIYIKQEQVCNRCLVNTYTLDQIRCIDCPYSAVCLGGSSLNLKPGYWRSDYSSDLIVTCSNYPENCIGDITQDQSSSITQTDELTMNNFDSDRFCKKGLVGPLCETCDIRGNYWEAQFTTRVKYNCAKCSDISANTIITTLVIMWTIFTIMISVYSLINDIEKDLQSEYLRKLGLLHGNIKDLSRQKSCLYKILLYHFQIFSIVFTFGVTYPFLLEVSVSSVSNQMHYLSYSFDCIITKYVDLNKMPMVYIKNLIAYLLPVSLFIVYMIFFGIGVLFKIVRPRLYLIWTAFFFIILVFQPQIVEVNIQTLACRNIAGHQYIQADLTQDCYSRKHIFFVLVLILPGIILYQMIVPLTTMYILYKNRDKLDKFCIKFKYGFIYYEYKRSAYYWETVKMFQRILIFIAISFFETDKMTKGAVILALIQIYMIACQQVKPYLSLTLTKIDLYSQLINFTAILLTMVIVQSQNLVLLVLYTMFLALLNIGWLILVIKDVAINYLRRDIHLMLKKIQSLLYSRKRFFYRGQARMERLILALMDLLGVNKQDKTLRLWGVIRKSFQEYLKRKQQVVNPLSLLKIISLQHDNTRRETISDEDKYDNKVSFESVMKEQFLKFQFQQSNQSFDQVGTNFMNLNKTYVLEPKNISFQIEIPIQVDIQFPSPEIDQKVQSENDDPDEQGIVLINTIRKSSYHYKP